MKVSKQFNHKLKFNNYPSTLPPVYPKPGRHGQKMKMLLSVLFIKLHYFIKSVEILTNVNKLIPFSSFFLLP